MVHTVVATATVQTPHRASSGVQIAGKVAAVNVQEGDHFRRGQVLLSLDDREAQAAWVGPSWGAPSRIQTASMARGSGAHRTRQ